MMSCAMLIADISTIILLIHIVLLFIGVHCLIKMDRETAVNKFLMFFLDVFLPIIGPIYVFVHAGKSKK